MSDAADAWRMDAAVPDAVDEPLRRLSSAQCARGAARPRVCCVQRARTAAGGAFVFFCGASSAAVQTAVCGSVSSAHCARGAACLGGGDPLRRERRTTTRVTSRGVNVELLPADSPAIFAEASSSWRGMVFARVCGRGGLYWPRYSSFWLVIAPRYSSSRRPRRPLSLAAASVGHSGSRRLTPPTPPL